MSTRPLSATSSRALPSTPPAQCCVSCVVSCGDRLLTLFSLGGASLLFSDGEFNLYNVILFKKMADDFKTQARKKKYVVYYYYCYHYTGRACRARAAHMPRLLVLTVVYPPPCASLQVDRA